MPPKRTPRTPKTPKTPKIKSSFTPKTSETPETPKTPAVSFPIFQFADEKDTDTDLFTDPEPLPQIIELPKGTYLYRGRTSKNIIGILPRWLAFRERDADIYGFVDVFVTTRNVYLLNPEDPEIYDLMNNTLHKLFPENPDLFSLAFVQQSGTIFRDSEFEADEQILNIMKQAKDQQMIPKEISGWMTREMPTVAEQSKHHAEIALFDPEEHPPILSFAGTIDKRYSPSREIEIARNRIAGMDAVKRKDRRKQRRYRQSP